jgi:hypothetical protein
MREMAACMREHGFDVPDPVVTAGPNGRVTARAEADPDDTDRPDFDPEDPEFRAAERECADEVGLDDFGPGRGPGGGGGDGPQRSVSGSDE